MSMNFKTALITGGGGGIGKAIAKYFISQGKKVIICGRTEKNLVAAAQELGHGTSYYGTLPSPTNSIPTNNGI